MHIVSLLRLLIILFFFLFFFLNQRPKPSRKRMYSPNSLLVPVEPINSEMLPDLGESWKPTLWYSWRKAASANPLHWIAIPLGTPDPVVSGHIDEAMHDCLTRFQILGRHGLLKHADSAVGIHQVLCLGELLRVMAAGLICVVFVFLLVLVLDCRRLPEDRLATLPKPIPGTMLGWNDTGFFCRLMTQ